MEGKKHEVRILVYRAELSLAKLKRVRLGNLHLKSLPKGAYKILSGKEKDQIFKKTSSNKKAPHHTI